MNQRVADLCSRDVMSCTPDTNLAAAGCMMWEQDCGFLPVVDSHGRTVGVITDRDICMAVATKGKSPVEISVRQAMNEAVHACHPNDSALSALETMGARRIRRLPVLDQAGKPQGVLTLGDIARAISTPKRTARPAIVDPDSFILAYQLICEKLPHSKKVAVV